MWLHSQELGQPPPRAAREAAARAEHDVFAASPEDDEAEAAQATLEASASMEKVNFPPVALPKLSGAE